MPGTVAKRGRKNLMTDSKLLLDAFQEVTANKFSKLKIYYDRENEGKLKAFTEKEKYPYKLGYQAKEYEIVNIDITKGIELGNNSRDLFNGNLMHFNEEFTASFDPSNE